MWQLLYNAQHIAKNQTQKVISHVQLQLLLPWLGAYYGLDALCGTLAEYNGCNFKKLIDQSIMYKTYCCHVEIHNATGGLPKLFLEGSFLTK
jgi:hypothetical protein